MIREPDSLLRHYAGTVWRRRWAVLIAFIVPVAVAVVITVRATKMYQGSASVVISRQSLADQVTNTSDPTGSASDFLNIVQTYASSARALAVARSAARAVPSAHVTAANLLKHSSVTASQDSDILSFSVQNPSPSLAQRLTSAYATAFARYQRRQSIASIRTALGQIDVQLAHARAAKQASPVATLTARAEELRTLEALQTSNLVYTSAASASLASPKKTTNVALGVLGGIVLAALLAALLETLDTRVRTPAEIEDILGLPLLGRITPPERGFENRVVSLVDPSNPQTEDFRVLRTNLELQAPRDQAKVVMVASSVELEGKSLTTANLAVLAASAGRRVILVDLDLRQPAQHLLFQTGGHAPGVTTVLGGQVALEDALTEVPLPVLENHPVRGGSLRLLRSGNLPPDPGEIVASDQLEELIRSLRDQSDVIFIDTPPSLRVGDASATSRFCDVVFLVARIAKVKRPMLAELRGVMSACPPPVIGFAATGHRHRVRAYGARPDIDGVRETDQGQPVRADTPSSDSAAAS